MGHLSLVASKFVCTISPKRGLFLGAGAVCPVTGNWQSKRQRLCLFFFLAQVEDRGKFFLTELESSIIQRLEFELKCNSRHNTFYTILFQDEKRQLLGFTTHALSWSPAQLGESGSQIPIIPNLWIWHRITKARDVTYCCFGAGGKRGYGSPLIPFLGAPFDHLTLSSRKNNEKERMISCSVFGETNVQITVLRFFVQCWGAKLGSGEH